MSVVVDASLLAVLALNDPRAPLVEAKLRQWAEAGETLHAPFLMPYEAANALVRTVAAGTLSLNAVEEAWAVIAGVEVELHPLGSGPQVVGIARQLARHSAYDAAYIVLTQALRAELWTFDGPLAQQRDRDWHARSPSHWRRGLTRRNPGGRRWRSPRPGPGSPQIL